MVKKNKTVITDKQSAIKQCMRNQLLLCNAIDANGTIIDLERFHNIVNDEIRKCQKEMAENETENCVVKDQMLQSCLIGDLEYLESLAKHTKNIDPLIETPIESREDLPKKPKKVLFPGLAIAGIIIKDKITSWLQH